MSVSSKKAVDDKVGSSARALDAGCSRAAPNDRVYPLASRRLAIVGRWLNPCIITGTWALCWVRQTTSSDQARTQWIIRGRCSWLARCM